jgi:hypothetical protein
MAYGMCTLVSAMRLVFLGCRNNNGSDDRNLETSSWARSLLRLINLKYPDVQQENRAMAPSWLRCLALCALCALFVDAGLLVEDTFDSIIADRETEKLVVFYRSSEDSHTTVLERAERAAAVVHALHDHRIPARAHVRAECLGCAHRRAHAPARAVHRRCRARCGPTSSSSSATATRARTRR